MALSKAMRGHILARDNYTCRYCGASGPRVQLHVDHIVPRSLGGLDRWDNLLTACARCNLAKGAKMPDYETVGWLMATSYPAAVHLSPRHCFIFRQTFVIAWRTKSDRIRDYEFPIPEGWVDVVDDYFHVPDDPEYPCEAVGVAVADPTISPDQAFERFCGAIAMASVIHTRTTRGVSS